MKVSGLFLAGILLFGCVTPVEEPKESRTQYEGGWAGSLEVGLARLRIAFAITKVGDAYQASIDSPDQGAFGIAVDAVTESETGLILSSSEVGGILEIARPDSLEPDSLDAVWKQSGQQFPLSLTRRPLPLTWGRPQEPLGDLPYAVEEVRFDGEEPEVRLAGTLFIPQNATLPGQAALAILVSGSGPQDRNESLAGHKPFLVLADRLARRGIAVLRYDDRGTAASTGVYAGSVLDDFAADAAGAYRFAIERGFSQIGYIGHSEGGLILGKIYKALGSAPAFMVSLAGPAVSGKEILLAQNEAIMLNLGQPQAVVDQARTINESIYQAVLNEPDDAKAKATIEQIYRDLGIPAANDQIALLISPWYRDFLAYDPEADLQTLLGVSPVLALYGTLDLQVPSGLNAPVFEAFLDTSAHAGSRVRVFEGKNHLFQPAITGAISEYSSIETTIDEQVLTAIADWIVEVLETEPSQ